MALGDRKILPLAVTAIAVIALVVALLPYLASTNLVRERIAQRISTWTGYRVTLSQAPDIDVFPSLTAVLRGVTVYPWSQEDTPLMEADSVEVGLSLFAAFRGDADINRITFLRPRFHLSSDDEWSFPVPAGGELSFTLRRAMRAIEKQDEGAADPGAFTARIGTFEIIDGRADFDDGNDSGNEITSLNATLSWPVLDRPLQLSANGIWRGEAVSFSFNSQAPLQALARKPFPVDAAFQATPATIRFNGKIDLAKDLFYDGKASFQTPSVRHALDWYGANVPALKQVGALSFTGTVSGDRRRLKLQDADIVAGETTAIGFVDIHDNKDATAISGTLAFNSLDLAAFLSAFGDVPGSDENKTEGFDLSFFDRLNLDMRLSAAEADAGPVALSEVAATIQVRNDIAAFDISGARALGGTIQASLQLDRTKTERGGEIRVLANEINGAQLAEAAGYKAFVPNAPLMLSAILKGPAQSWRSLVRGATGTVSASFGPGTLRGFDMKLFAAKLPTSGFFALRETAGNASAFEAINIKVAMLDGIAQIEKAVVTTATHYLSISGLIAPFASSVALSGALGELKDGEKTNELIFFLGGAPESPFVTPILPSMLPRG